MNAGGLKSPDPEIRDYAQAQPCLDRIRRWFRTVRSDEEVTKILVEAGYTPHPSMLAAIQRVRTKDGQEAAGLLQEATDAIRTLRGDFDVDDGNVLLVEAIAKEAVEEARNGDLDVEDVEGTALLAARIAARTVLARRGRPDFLTDRERRTLRSIADAYGGFLAITENGSSREGDLREIVALIHALQDKVLAQAAARAYPREFRVLGADSLTDRPAVAPLTLREFRLGGWISVEDRLPENGVPVLAFLARDPAKDLPPAIVVSTFVGGGHGWSADHVVCNVVRTVSFWRPLPAPPAAAS